MSAETTRFLEEQKIELTGHSPYSLDFVTNNFYFYPSVKDKLGGERFSRREETVDALNKHLKCIKFTSLQVELNKPQGYVIKAILREQYNGRLGVVKGVQGAGGNFGPGYLRPLMKDTPDRAKRSVYSIRAAGFYALNAYSRLSRAPGLALYVNMVPPKWAHLSDTSLQYFLPFTKPKQREHCTRGD
ncbi:hypothetical protein EVAR_61560_1 [Eumeta japonica]|uniref:Uncharacterized protein n=1 Tax=Eumeta variegata TaxID=151549 RepID=A0A4C1YV54_EUMVA|nr:hypothetical protein EVAR_61560_1 [Eumeta japonica]